MSEREQGFTPPSRREAALWLAGVYGVVVLLFAVVIGVPWLLVRSAVAKVVREQEATGTAMAQLGFQPAFGGTADDAGSTPTPDLRPTDAGIALTLPGSAAAATVVPPLAAPSPTPEAAPSAVLDDGNAAVIAPPAQDAPTQAPALPCADSLVRMRRVSENKGIFRIVVIVQGTNVTIDYNRPPNENIHWAGTFDKTTCTATGHYDDIVSKKIVGDGGTVTITRQGNGFTGTWQQIGGGSGMFDLLSTDQ